MLMTTYDTPFGTGRDGNVTLTTNTIASRDMWYNNLTLSPGIKLNANGYIIRVANVLTLNNGAAIHNNGADGTNAVGVKALGGAKGTLGGGGAGGATPSTWNPGNPGDNVTSNSLGGAGGVGKAFGGSYPGGNGGTVTPVTADVGGVLAVQTQLNAFYNGRNYVGVLYNGGAGGGSGASSSFQPGGGGGGGGGVLVVAAKTITGTSAFIEANGGNGFVTDSGPNGGGGGGGSVVVITNSLTGTTVRANGGTGNVAGQNGVAVTYLV